MSHLILASDKREPRRIDRGPQPKRHEGPWYGPSAWRRLQAEPVSRVELIAEWGRRWGWHVVVVLGCLLASAILVAWSVS